MCARASCVRTLTSRRVSRTEALQAQRAPYVALKLASSSACHPAMPVVAGRAVPWKYPFDGTEDLFKLPKLDRATVAGISVAIAGNILISLALNCQKLAHRRLEVEREHARELLDDLRVAVCGRLVFA